MDANAKKLETFNVRKNQRFQNKKRKVEALLNLFENDTTIMPKRKKKKDESLEKSYKDLKDELKKYVKKPEVEPQFYLTPLGRQAEISIHSPEKSYGSVKPLFVEDIYQLLLRSTIGHQSPYPLAWGKIEQPQNVAKTVLVCVQGITKSDVIKHREAFANLESILPNVVEIASSNLPFAAELCSLHRVTDFHVREKGTYSTMFPKEKEVKIDTPPEHSRGASRLHLLLSPIQMVMENYPFPQSVFEYSRSENYVFSKEAYSPVTEKSPIYSVDCEMCMTAAGKNELTRIAVVDEELKTVYHTLVKPRSHITNYLTRFSGITRKMLEEVETRLEDVQRHLQDILPPDVILCGQSLNNDLHALQMIHPYVIDTSVIFNSCGIRSKKDSLKTLAYIHLNKQIQTDHHAGHHPIEDAIAAMKLVKLKLKYGVTYGDACYEDSDSKGDIPSNGNKEIIENGGKPIENGVVIGEKSTDKHTDSFFGQLSKFSKKSCLIGASEDLKHYEEEVLTDSVTKVVKSNRKKILKASLKHLNEFDFVVTHFVFDVSASESSFEELNNILQQLFGVCGKRTMFTVLLSESDETKFADIKSGLFLATLKNEIVE